MKKSSKILTFLKKGTFWNASATIISVIVCFISYFQLRAANFTIKETNRLAGKTFLHNLKTDFFTTECRQLLALIEVDGLLFSHVPKGDKAKNPIGIFTKKDLKEYGKYGDSLISGKPFYYDAEIDNILLNHLEDLGYIYKDGMISKEDIYQNFSYYIISCHDNKAIQEYMAWIRRQDPTNKDLFDKFDLVYALVSKK